MNGEGGFVAIPTEIMRDARLPLAARAVFGVVLSYAWGGNPCTASIETLTAECGIGRSTLYGALNQLKAAGLLDWLTTDGRRTLYPVRRGIPLEGSPESGHRPDSGLPDTEVDEVVSAVPAGEERNGGKLRLLDGTSSEPSCAGARARPKPMTYGRIKVPAETAEMAERLLATFNEATGSKLGGRKRDGGPTGHLKQIVGAVMDREGEASESDWHRAVRNTAANPPQWIEGRLTLGHVFGAKAADHALANTGAVPIGIAAGNPITSPGRVDWGHVAETLEAQGL